MGWVVSPVSELPASTPAPSQPCNAKQSSKPSGSTIKSFQPSMASHAWASLAQSRAGKPATWTLSSRCRPDLWKMVRTKEAPWETLTYLAYQICDQDSDNCPDRSVNTKEILRFGPTEIESVESCGGKGHFIAFDNPLFYGVPYHTQ